MSTPASTVHTPIRIADRDEELQRIVEIVAEAVVCGRRARPSAAATAASAR